MRKLIILFISLFFLMEPKDIYVQEKMNIEVVCFGQIESVALASAILHNLSQSKDKNHKTLAIIDKVDAEIENKKAKDFFQRFRD